VPLGWREFVDNSPELINYPSAKGIFEGAIMYQRFESVQGVSTYWKEIHLNEAKAEVVVENGQIIDGEEWFKKPKRTKKKFDSPELAAKYFRYWIESEGMDKVGGDDVVLDPEEDFKEVKDKSADYRYYEHAEKGLFWDIDRYDETIDIWHGPIGKRGEQEIEEFEWANPAKKAYKEWCAKREAEGYKQVSKDGNTFLDAVEKEFGKLPPTYKTFMESGKFKEFNGFFVSGLPQFAGDAKFKVYFDKSEIIDLEVPKSNPKLLPICKLTKEESHYLAIDRSDKELAVWVVFQSDGPVRFMPSFEAFLAGLFKKGVSPFKALEKAHKEAEKLRKQENYAKALSTIEGPLAAFPPRAKSKDYFDESDDLRDVLAASYNLVGICLRKAEKFKEAAVAFENADRVKSIQVSSAPKLNLLDLYTYHLKDYKRAISYAKGFEAYDPNTRFYRLKALALATWFSGDRDLAKTLYEELKEVVGQDKKLRQIVVEELNEDAELSAISAMF